MTFLVTCCDYDHGSLTRTRTQSDGQGIGHGRSTGSSSRTGLYSGLCRSGHTAPGHRGGNRLASLTRPVSAAGEGGRVSLVF